MPGRGVDSPRVSAPVGGVADASNNGPDSTRIPGRLKVQNWDAIPRCPISMFVRVRCDLSCDCQTVVHTAETSDPAIACSLLPDQRLLTGALNAGWISKIQRLALEVLRIRGEGTARKNGRPGVEGRHSNDC